MAQRQEPILDLFADATSAKKDYRNAAEDLRRVRRRLQDALERADLKQDDAEVVNRHVRQNQFQAARREFRDRYEE